MLKYIEFRATVDGVTISVWDVHVEKETPKIYMLDWKRNPSERRKVMKNELGEIIGMSSLLHMSGFPNYKAFVEVDKVNKMINLMYEKATMQVADKLVEWEKRHDGLRQWAAGPTYNIGLKRRTPQDSHPVELTGYPD